MEIDHGSLTGETSPRYVVGEHDFEGNNGYTPYIRLGKLRETYRNLNGGYHEGDPMAYSSYAPCSGCVRKMRQTSFELQNKEGWLTKQFDQLAVSLWAVNYVADKHFLLYCVEPERLLVTVSGRSFNSALPLSIAGQSRHSILFRTTEWSTTEEDIRPTFPDQ